MTIHADFASQEYFRNPAAGIAKLRAAGPVVEVRFPIVGKVWTTTTQALADQVLKDSGTFTVRKDDGTVAGMQWWMPGIVRTLANSMLSMDDPDHRRLRDIVDEAFRRRAVLDIESHILAIGDELADKLFANGSPADLVERYARKLPLAVICELLGLPLADRPKFVAWAGGFTRFTGVFGFLSIIPNVLAMRRYKVDCRCEGPPETVIINSRKVLIRSTVILGAFMPDECAEYFQNSGYGCTNLMHHALDLGRALLKPEQLNNKIA